MADVLGDAVSTYRKILQEDENAKNTLKDRGLTNKAIDYFKLGATGPLGKFYYNFKKEYNYSDEIMEEHGLLLSNGDSIETFKNSVIIPQHDTEGRVISISARRLDDHPVKYMNLPHRNIHDFFGVEVLANRHLFKTAGAMKNPLFVCEGQFDTMILQQVGFPSVGILGVNNMRQAMFDHFRWFNNVVLCFDNDRPGINARKKMASHIKAEYPDIGIFYLDLDEGINDVNKFFLEGYTKKSDYLKRIKEMDNVKPVSFKKKKFNKNTTDAKLQAIRQIKIKDFIESTDRHIQWAKHKSLLKIKCPLPYHKDSVNSFTVYQHTNTFYCFGCGCGGDIITFVINYFGTNYKTALNILEKWSKAR